MSVISKIADFMGGLLDEVRAHRADTHHLKSEQSTMNATLQTVLDKVTAQGQQLAAQSQQIAQLTAAKSQQEQADLDQISTALDTNSQAIGANTDAMAMALTPPAAG